MKKEIEIKTGTIIQIQDELTKHLAEDVHTATQALADVTNIISIHLERCKKLLWDRVHLLYPGTKTFQLSYDAENHTVTVEESDEMVKMIQDLKKQLMGMAGVNTEEELEAKFGDGKPGETHQGGSH